MYVHSSKVERLDQQEPLAFDVSSLHCSDIVLSNPCVLSNGELVCLEQRRTQCVMCLLDWLVGDAEGAPSVP